MLGTSLVKFILGPIVYYAGLREEEYILLFALNVSIPLLWCVNFLVQQTIFTPEIDLVIFGGDNIFPCLASFLIMMTSTGLGVYQFNKFSLL